MWNRRQRREQLLAELREQILAEQRKELLDAYASQCLQRYIVTLTDDSVVSGVLVEVTAATLVFDDIKVLQEGRDWSPGAGRLYVDRVKVRYSQLVSTGGV